jgi:hypothetical protein
MSKKVKTNLLTDLDQKREADSHIVIDENDRKNAINLFLPLETRLKALINYYNKENDEVGELIGCIVGMYFFSKTKNLTEYVQAICTLYELPIIYRIDCVKQLDNGQAYVLLNQLFVNELPHISALPTPLRVSTIVYLMNCELFKNEASAYFCDVISDHTIDVVYRYRIIQSLEQHFTPPKHKKDKGFIEKEKDKFLFYARNACHRFIDDQTNPFTYRAIACQYMFEKCKPSPDDAIKMETFLLEIADDVTLADDVRADACDILLQNGGDESREKAQRALFVLAGGHLSRNNIFKNAQNVHIRSIEESVEQLIEKLSTYYPRNKTVYDFETSYENILEKIVDLPQADEVKGALLRITIDRAVYGNSNMTLSTILAKMWTYIQDSEHREELEKRLFEELVDSNSKCSTGYVSRIVNTLSGYDEEMSLRISFEDQIIANVEARLNACIQKISDENEMDDVLQQMTIPVIHYELRGKFLKFFRENISVIREELYGEFRQYMTDLDYDFYFRKAIIHYEGCF